MNDYDEDEEELLKGEELEEDEEKSGADKSSNEN